MNPKLGLIPFPVPIPPSFEVSASTLLEPLRGEVQALYTKLPPELQAPFTGRLVECNDHEARGEFEESAACLRALRDALVPAVDEYEKRTFALDSPEGVSLLVYGAVGAAILAAVFV